MKLVVGIDGKSGITEKIPYLSYLFFRLVLYIVISVLPDALEISQHSCILWHCLHIGRLFLRLCIFSHLRRRYMYLCLH